MNEVEISSSWQDVPPHPEETSLLCNKYKRKTAVSHCSFYFSMFLKTLYIVSSSGVQSRKAGKMSVTVRHTFKKCFSVINNKDTRLIMSV